MKKCHTTETPVCIAVYNTFNTVIHSFDFPLIIVCLVLQIMMLWWKQLCVLDFTQTSEGSAKYQRRNGGNLMNYVISLQLLSQPWWVLFPKIKTNQNQQQIISINRKLPRISLKFLVSKKKWNKYALSLVLEGFLDL